MGILSAFRFAFQNVFFTPVLYGVIASLAIFSASWEKGDRVKDQLTDPFRSQQDTFDFIIVGGGSAGAVLANRLSKYHTVLLLEAGGESHPFQAIPALALFIPNYPATDWSHKSVPQTTSCLACVDKRYTFSQGKNLGGSGNLNYMVHLRGSPKDFDNWARITGDPTWSYDQVLPHFTASEHFVGSTTDGGAHGVGGPLQIEMPSEIGLANEWNWAGQEMGYPHLDLNGKYEEGFDAVYYPTKRGVRIATYRAFIQPVRYRSSLLIRKFAHVNKVLIREETNFAYGVEYDRHGQTRRAFANKEVILSAGTLQTPKLLMLSGIGPRSILESCNIPVRSDLPVGQGLQDHISTLIGPFLINSPKTFSYDDDVSAKSFLQFVQQGTGPLTTTGFQATALIASNLAKVRGQQGWPDIQLTLLGLAPHRLFHSDLAHAFGLREDILQRFFLHARGKSAFFIIVTVARPESRGEVSLQSASPYKPLIIKPAYFSDPVGKDVAVMIEGIHRALHLAENTTVFQNCGVRLAEKCFPGCEGHIYRSDAYWECYLRHLSISMNDHTGTAQMGYRSSPYGVVDPSLKVMGVNSLRVVDASVMPTIVGANTQAATIMIAEKASALILKEWGDTTLGVNYDVSGGSAVYGPPPLPSSYGPPPLPTYGPPQPSPLASTTPNKVTDAIIIDDSLAHLTPPGLPDGSPTFNYAVTSPSPTNYDSFDLLRTKGLESLQSINLQGQDQGQLVLSSPTPTYSDDNIIELPATHVDEDDVFTTPRLYNEVYDPTTPYPSPSSSPRGGKALDFPAPPENFLSPPDPEVSQTTQESILTSPKNSSSSIILRKRKKLYPPNVTVNPRGHLGFQDEEERLLGTKSTPSPANWSSTSVAPLPTNVVVIKARRVRVRRKRLQNVTTTTPMPEIETKSVISAVLGRLRNFIPPPVTENQIGDEPEVNNQFSSRSGEDVTPMGQDMVTLEDISDNMTAKSGNNNQFMMVMDMDPVPNILSTAVTTPMPAVTSTLPDRTTINYSRKIVPSKNLSYSAERMKRRMAKFVRSKITTTKATPSSSTTYLTNSYDNVDVTRS